MSFVVQVAGTEVGITEPQAVFSSCFGEPFLVWHPAQYAQKLAERLATYNADAWLINTGWVSGSYGQGRRCPLKYTRAIIDAIHDGALAEVCTTMSSSSVLLGMIDVTAFPLMFW